eukprot:1956450-Pleurochrysis_carterae.AAC.3
MALKQVHDQLASARASREQTVSAQPATADRASLESHMTGHNGNVAGDHAANRAAPVTAPDPGDVATHVRIAERSGATVSGLDTLREQLALLLASSSADVRRHAPDDALPVDHAASTPHRFSTCALLSILLNVAAYGAAVAIGLRQL